MKFAFIAREKATFPIDLLCSVLGVSRAGFYAAQGRPVAAHQREDQQLAVHVAAAHAASRRRYGSPRVHQELQAQGHDIGRHRVARLMREQGLRARKKRRFQRTTDSQHGLPVAPNLLDRQFTVATPNTAWVSDITYLWTREGWLYLVVILDLFSRRVVGWALHDRITRQLALDALAMALRHRQPGPGLVHHSDRGSQYASGDYQAVLAAHGVVCSMSRRANCWDNAVAESFFSTLKIELAHDADWTTHAAARTDVAEYLEIFYNTQRRHSVLGYLSPAAFERQHRENLAA
jgi:transposase InsO family protein